MNEWKLGNIILKRQFLKNIINTIIKIHTSKIDTQKLSSIRKKCKRQCVKDMNLLLISERQQQRKKINHYRQLDNLLKDDVNVRVWVVF